MQIALSINDVRVLKGTGSRFKSRLYLRYLLQLMRWISSLLIIAQFCALHQQKISRVG